MTWIEAHFVIEWRANAEDRRCREGQSVGFRLAGEMAPARQFGSVGLLRDLSATGLPARALVVDRRKVCPVD
jgi:hypothetical protein